MMVKVLWLLGTPTFPPIIIIFGLVVVILCHLGLGIIQPWVIPKKNKSYYLLSLIKHDKFSVADDGRGVVDNSTIHFSPHKVYLADKGMIWLFIHIKIISQHPPWHHHSVRIIQLVLLLVLHFFVAAGDGKCSLSPRNTHFTSQNFDCYINGGDFFIFY